MARQRGCVHGVVGQGRGRGGETETSSQRSRKRKRCEGEKKRRRQTDGARCTERWQVVGPRGKKKWVGGKDARVRICVARADGHEPRPSRAAHRIPRPFHHPRNRSPCAVSLPSAVAHRPLLSRARRAVLRDVDAEQYGRRAVFRAHNDGTGLGNGGSRLVVVVVVVVNSVLVHNGHARHVCAPIPACARHIHTLC